MSILNYNYISATFSTLHISGDVKLINENASDIYT